MVCRDLPRKRLEERAVPYTLIFVLSAFVLIGFVLGLVWLRGGAITSMEAFGIGLFGGAGTIATDYAILAVACRGLAKVRLVSDGTVLRAAPAFSEGNIGWLVLEEDRLRFVTGASYRNREILLGTIESLKVVASSWSTRWGIEVRAGGKRYFFDIVDAREWVEKIAGSR